MFKDHINCPYCNKTILEDWSCYIVSSDVIDEDRQMGAEVEHSIECDEYECPNSECKKVFKVTGSVWEYPAGAYNDSDLETEAIGDIDDNE